MSTMLVCPVCLLLWLRAVLCLITINNTYIRISHAIFHFVWGWQKLTRWAWVCNTRHRWIRAEIRCCPWFHVVYRVLHFFLFFLKRWSFPTVFSSSVLIRLRRPPHRTSHAPIFTYTRTHSVWFCHFECKHTRTCLTDPINVHLDRSKW